MWVNSTGDRERCPYYNTEISLFIPGKEELLPPLQKCFDPEGQKNKMRKALILAAVLENYIPKDVHVSFCILL